MLEKLRLKRRRRSSVVATDTQSTQPSIRSRGRRQSSDQKPVGFFDLPPELRNQIYELAADASSLLLFPDSRKPSSPGLLLASRQMCREYRPILLARAPLRVNIFDFNFRPLMRVIGSLYPSELKALRANTRLRITLHISKASAKDGNMANLRRWAVKQSEHLDRLAWSYEVTNSQTSLLNKPQVEEMIRECKENMLALTFLSTKLHESLVAEMEPVLQAMLRQLRNLRRKHQDLEMGKVLLPRPTSAAST